MKFALLGKNISHSKSPFIYKNIIKQDFEYDLLDIEEESKLPRLDMLSTIYTGLNITSPYKRYYFKNTIVDESVKNLGAINCIRFINNQAHSTNTDFLAMKDLIKGFYPISDVIILGSGVMAQVSAHLLNELKIPYKFYSRKLKNLDQLDQVLTSKDNQSLVINCLSRDCILKLKSFSQVKFWDLNYGILEHVENLSKQVSYYQSGEELLYKQAELAVKFWKL